MNNGEIISVTLSVFSIISYLITFYTFYRNNKKDRDETERRNDERREAEIKRYTKMEMSLDRIQLDLVDLKKSMEGSDKDILDINNRLISCEKRLDYLEKEINSIKAYKEEQ